MYSAGDIRLHFEHMDSNKAGLVMHDNKCLSNVFSISTARVCCACGNSS